MMKYLIVPDVHNNVDWAENLVTAHPGHQVVFLGDYFDSYHDTPADAGRTAEWLHYSLQKPNRIHLMGNHDLPYRWRHMRCPGYQLSKGRAARVSMTHNDWEQVRFTHVIQAPEARPLLLSHAGFTLANLYGVEDFRDVARGGRLEFLRDRLPQEHLQFVQKYGAIAHRAAHEQRHHFWFNQGSRMGELEEGGPFWLDKDDMHAPLPGVDQIVGHTGVKEPTRQCSPNKANPDLEVWFIDGAGKFAVTIDGTLDERGGLKITPIHARGPLLAQPILRRGFVIPN